MTTTFKMPEPDGFDSQMRQETYYKDTLTDALRDVLEQAARIAFNATCPDGDDYAHGYNKAAAEITRAIRAMKEQIK